VRSLRQNRSRKRIEFLVTDLVEPDRAVSGADHSGFETGFGDQPDMTAFLSFEYVLFHVKIRYFTYSISNAFDSMILCCRLMFIVEKQTQSAILGGV
jgi:hypothetical protein